jgi:hypothetical protein
MGFSDVFVFMQKVKQLKRRLTASRIDKVQLSQALNFLNMCWSGLFIFFFILFVFETPFFCAYLSVVQEAKNRES